VHHDDDVHAELKRLPVTRLLVAPVAAVDLVADRVQAELAADRDRPVGACVIDEH
jgi:hypothetical protein